MAFHVEGHFGVGATLEVDQQVGQPIEQASVLFDDLDRDRRCGVGLRECKRRREQACHDADTQEKQHEKCSASWLTYGLMRRHRLSLTVEGDGLGMAVLRALAARDAECATRRHFAAHQ